jgi:predicted nucleotide-binding protein (sugar kinase/HSP70/actin superfamily)
VIEGILERSRTPFFAFKDLDENKPSGSLRIRVETVEHFLRLHRERELSVRAAELVGA